MTQQWRLEKAKSLKMLLLTLSHKRLHEFSTRHSNKTRNITRGWSDNAIFYCASLKDEGKWLANVTIYNHAVLNHRLRRISEFAKNSIIVWSVIISFLPWALLKGPKSSFVVVFVLAVLVVVLVGVETWVKNGTNGTKNVREQNLFLIEQKIAPNWTQSREFEVRKKKFHVFFD